MGRLKDFFSGRTVATFIERARRSMAAGKLEEATRLIERGLALYPTSTALVELRLTIRRAAAHAEIRAFEVRIEADDDPRAYEGLIQLYRALELPDQARRRAEAYAENHSHRDAAHLYVGMLQLESFFEELRARHGHQAHESLSRAATLNTLAIQPRMLLAELYFCIGASKALAGMMRTLEQLAPGQDGVIAAGRAARQMAEDADDDGLDGIFERIEFRGHLARAPEDWPLSKRRDRGPEATEEVADAKVQELIARGVIDELVLLRRDGTVLTHATLTGVRSESRECPIGQPAEEGLLEVVRSVASHVFPHAQEFDLGKFKRCTIRGRFGNIIVGRLGPALGGVRGPRSAEPLRMWEQVAVELEGVAMGEGQ